MRVYLCVTLCACACERVCLGAGLTTPPAVLAVNARKAELEGLARVRVLAEQLRGWPDPAFRLTNSAHRRLLSEGTGHLQIAAAAAAADSAAAPSEPVFWYLFSDFVAVAKAGTVIERIVGASQEVQHVAGQFWCKDSMWRRVAADERAVQLFRKGFGATLVLAGAREREEMAELLSKHLQAWDDVQVMVFAANQPADKKERRHKSQRMAPLGTPTATPASSGKDLLKREKKEKKEREKEAKKEEKDAAKEKEREKEKEKDKERTVPPPSPSPRKPPASASQPAAAAAATRTARALYAYEATADT